MEIESRRRLCPSRAFKFVTTFQNRFPALNNRRSSQDRNVMRSSRFSKCPRGNDGNARDGYHSKPWIAGATMSPKAITVCCWQPVPFYSSKRGTSCAMDALTNCLFPKKARILHKYSTRLVLNHPSVGSQFHSPPGAWEEERLMALSRKKNTSEHCFIWMTVVWDAVRGGRNAENEKIFQEKGKGQGLPYLFTTWGLC